MPALNFPTGAPTGAPIAIQTTDTALHTARASKKTELSLIAMNVDGSADYNLTLKFGSTDTMMVKIEKLAGPYQVLPPIMLDAGVAVTARTSVANKLFVVPTVTEYD